MSGAMDVAAQRLGEGPVNPGDVPLALWPQGASGGLRNAPAQACAAARIAPWSRTISRSPCSSAAALVWTE